MAPRRLGILAPMPSEMRPIVKAFGLTSTSKEHGGEYAGTIGTAEVIAARAGMGMSSAAAAARARRLP
jgi:hypothetical protein